MVNLFCSIKSHRKADINVAKYICNTFASQDSMEYMTDWRRFQAVMQNTYSKWQIGRFLCKAPNYWCYAIPPCRTKYKKQTFLYNILFMIARADSVPSNQSYKPKRSKMRSKTSCKSTWRRIITGCTHIINIKNLKI